ncbi:hypothetical protein [Candidatus Methanoperedens nitratireducens]|uniref:Uncharacterized protein n=1 Tax=Candidatus Methanoperedens nitratireducens TaxID=1392998 RepID=A0A284VKA9_9EURY|nr:hypothetical protein [Candidatus Methanoperedens nitroreducens]SNQ59683.1 hypothetical protein MNV_1270013 [Candidatus Methanoperedens nitroreducens]
MDGKQSHKIIVPLPPRYIVEKLQLGPLELSWDQVKVMLVCAVLTAIIIGAGEGTSGLLLNFVVLSVIWGLYYKYARTHEVLVESKIIFAHKLRKLKGLDRYSSISSPDKQVSELYRFNIKNISKTGVIDFGDNRFGVILGCDTRWLDDEELALNITRVSGFLNSIQPRTLLKVRASSQIPYLNPVERMVMEQVNQPRSHNEKALLYSLHDLSSRTPKTTNWDVKIFIGVVSNPEEIETLMMTLLPGVLNRLQAAHTVSAVITQRDKIYNIFANDNTRHQVQSNRTPALYGEKAIWKNTLRQIMQGSIIENKDHLLVNNTEYISCIIVGIPVGGVSGFPPTLSPEILTQIYRLSASEEHVIRIDQSIYPIDSPKALVEIKRAMNTIKGNEESLQNNQTARFDMGLDQEDLRALYAQIKDGKESMFDINFIVTVFSPSYTSLLAGISKVRAILSANNIMNRVPNGRILETIQCTQFLPYYDEKISVWLPTSGISRITPLVNGPNNIVSSRGVYFGNDIHTNQEIIIDLDKLGASHTLMIGPTRSGKTTAMAITGIRTILNGDDAIYITNKPDSTTNYLAVAEYFSDVSQIINLGRQPDGRTCYNINPLEIIFNENVPFDPISKFYEHVNTVKFFLNLLTGGDRTHKQMTYIGETLVELYAKFGIVPEDRKTWRQEKQPTFLDLYDIWERDKKKYKSDATIEAVYSRTSSLRDTLRWLSNPTNVDLTRQYTVIDLSAIPIDTQEAMNYLLTAILALRFNINSKRKTTIMVDEAGVFLKNARLQDEFSRMLKQAGSYGVRIIIGSQQLSDLSSIGPELRANIFISEVYGLNIGKSIDDVVRFFKLSNNDAHFLLSCSRPGMCAVSVGYPYATTYHMQRVASDLEAQILFGKQKRQVAYTFIHPDLESFAKEQGVIMSDWINGDTSVLRTERLVEWAQRVIGTGKVFAYIDKGKLNNGLILNQSKEHFLSVVQIAACFIKRNIKVEVNHYDDADVVAWLPDGPVAFEYQTPGYNDPKILTEKRKSSESKYGRLLFVGNTQSVREVAQAIGTDEIVIPRGAQLEEKIKALLGETNLEQAI